MHPPARHPELAERLPHQRQVGVGPADERLGRGVRPGQGRERRGGRHAEQRIQPVHHHQPPAESAASPRSDGPKITERSSRFAYTSTTRPRPACSADFRMDITGVIPLPAANSRKSPSSERGLNVPAGGSRSSTVPARTRSRIQFDAYPPSVRLTVMAGRSPSSGELDSE